MGRGSCKLILYLPPGGSIEDRQPPPYLPPSHMSSPSPSAHFVAEKETGLSRPKILDDAASSHTSVTIDPASASRQDVDINAQFEHEAYGPAAGEEPEDSYEVNIPPDDPENPKSWSRMYRWYITALSAMLLFNAYVALPLFDHEVCPDHMKPTARLRRQHQKESSLSSLNTSTSDLRWLR